MFNEIIEKIMFRMSDLEIDVEKAAGLVNEQLLKLVISHASTNYDLSKSKIFDLNRFMVNSTSKIKSENPTIRHFLFGWINDLNEIANIDLIMYLPDIL